MTKKNNMGKCTDVCVSDKLLIKCVRRSTMNVSGRLLLKSTTKNPQKIKYMRYSRAKVCQMTQLVDSTAPQPWIKKKKEY